MSFSNSLKFLEETIIINQNISGREVEQTKLSIQALKEANVTAVSKYEQDVIKPRLHDKMH